MAWEIKGFSPGGLKAAADLSAKQFYGVKATANNQVNIITADGEPGLGILQNAPGSGSAAEVMMSGVTKAIVSSAAAVAAGDLWGFNSDGTIQTVVDNNTGASLGYWAMGIVLEGAAAGGIATVTVGLTTGLIGSTFGAG